MFNAKAYSAASATSPLASRTIRRRNPTDHDVQIEILFCGKKVGVVGLGGLGHMGGKFARAFGAHVVVFTTSPGKTEDALRLGADEVVVSRNADEMKKRGGCSSPM